MTVPSKYELSAAVLVAKSLTDESLPTDHLPASLAAVRTGGLYAQEDLIRGFRLLRGCDLVLELNGHYELSERLSNLLQLPDTEVDEVLLALALSTRPPLWLGAAVNGDVFKAENIPDQALHVLSQMFPDPQQREAYLLSLGQTVDPERLRELGTEGEEYVVSACRSHWLARSRRDLADRVVRVSLVSDVLGYDVTTPASDSAIHHIEVKTTSNPDRSTFFLSRNEARVAIGDPTWALVVVRSSSASLHLVGWCLGRNLEVHLPTDGSENAKWASVKISLHDHELTPGLPLRATGVSAARLANSVVPGS